MLHAFKEVGQLQELNIRVISGNVTGACCPDSHSTQLEKLDGLFLTIGQSPGKYLYFDRPVGFFLDQIPEGLGKKLISIESVILVVKLQCDLASVSIQNTHGSHHHNQKSCKC